MFFLCEWFILFIHESLNFFRISLLKLSQKNLVFYFWLNFSEFIVDYFSRFYYYCCYYLLILIPEAIQGEMIMLIYALSLHNPFLNFINFTSKIHHLLSKSVKFSIFVKLSMKISSCYLLSDLNKYWRISMDLICYSLLLND